MATRIPLPGNGGEALQKGVESGTNLWQQMLGHGITQGRMHQQGQQFEKSHALAQQVENRHQELQPFLINQYKMEAAKHPYIIDQYKQAAALAPIERKYKLAQIDDFLSQVAERQADQTLLQQFMNNQGGQTSGDPMQNMEQQQAQPSMGPVPQSPMGFPQQERQMSQNVAPPSLGQIQQGFGQKAHPYVAARLKKKFGYDPNEETPEEKAAQRISEFKEKEDYKYEKKKKDMTEVTPATRNEAQRIITATNSIVPLLNDLINMDIPNQNFALLSPNDQAKYKRKSFLAADKLMTISKLPRIQESLHGSLELLRMGNFEDPALFKEGLKELRTSILDEAKDQQELLKTGKIPEVSLNFSESTSGTTEGDKKEKMVIVRNKQTGEEKYVSEEEARKMGAIK
jgi:hypothetical protein